MKKVLFISLLFSFHLGAQTIDTIKAGYVANVSIDGLSALGGDQWDVTVNSATFLGGYDPDIDSNYGFLGIAVGMNFYVNCTLFRIQAITDPIPGIQKVLTVEKPTGIGSAPIIGLKAGIFSRTYINNLSRFPNFAVNPGEMGLSTQDLACLLNDFVSRVDSIAVTFENATDTINLARPVLRTIQIGDTIGPVGASFSDYAAFHFFSEPTLAVSSSPTTSLIEVGDSVRFTINATTTNPGAATLSNGSLFVVSPSAELDPFGAATSGSALIDFTPIQTPVDTFESYSYQFRASQDWVGGAESGTATSNTLTKTAVYPVFYGMVADTATAFADIYGEMTKLLQAEGNKTVAFTGTGLIFYAIPQTWSDTNLSSIIDPNGFNATASFDRVTYPTVTSTGLTNDYTSVAYVVYFLNTGSTTTSASNYTFNR